MIKFARKNKQEKTVFGSQQAQGAHLMNEQLRQYIERDKQQFERWKFIVEEKDRALREATKAHQSAERVWSQATAKQLKRILTLQRKVDASKAGDDGSSSETLDALVFRLEQQAGASNVLASSRLDFQSETLRLVERLSSRLGDARLALIGTPCAA